MYALYNSFHPVSLLMGVPPSLSSRDSAVTAVWIAGSALFGFTVAQILRPSRVGSRPFLDLKRITRPALIPLLALAGLCTMWWLFHKSGVGATTIAERRENVDSLYTQTFVVCGYLVSAVLSISVFLLNRLSRLAVCVTVSASGLYVLLLLWYGFRLQALPVLLAYFILAQRQPRLARAAPILAVLASVALIYIGLVREKGTGSSRPFLYVLAANTEFSFPMQTLAFYIEHPKASLEWGYTYIHAPTVLIPRAIYPEKGISMAQQFLLDAFGTTEFQGYTFTLNTEAFLNFSYAGPFLVQFLAWFGVNTILRKHGAIPVWYFCLWILAGELNRSNFASVCYGVFFTWLGCLVVLRLSGVCVRQPDQPLVKWAGLPLSISHSTLERAAIGSR
jgi:hypothetical protein